MKVTDNKGFDPEVVASYKARVKSSGRNFLMAEPDENNEEYVHFYFIGKSNNREVVYDAVLYTLRLQHQGDLFELAEQRASAHFPEYKKIADREGQQDNLQHADEMEEEIGLFMAEVILGLEDEGQVKVREHVDMDLEIDFGVGLDAGLHVEKITTSVIEKFIRDFNADQLSLDETLYSFQSEDDALES